MRILLLLLLTAACAPYPQRVRQPVTIPNNATVEAARGAELAAGIEAERARVSRAADSVYMLAVGKCSPEHCAGIARGEIMIGMTQNAVMAATRSAPSAWAIRDAGEYGTMVSASNTIRPFDRMGEVMTLQMERGGVSVISRRTQQGLTVVARPQDATAQAIARQQAELLVREGDELVAANDLAGALNRYDRASVLDPNQPEIEYKAARLLDLQLRPVEALMRYQRFLLSMELEVIKAQGEANARLAEAIALAQQRIVILERQVK